MNINQDSIWKAYLDDKRRLPDSLEWWVKPLLVDNGPALGLLRDPQAPREIVSSLAVEFPSAFWRSDHAEHSPFVWESWGEWGEAYRDQHDPIERLLSYPEATVPFLRWCWENGHREGVLRHPRCTIELINELASGSQSADPYRQEKPRNDEYYALFLASHPGTGARRLESLLDAKSPAIAAVIAQNPGADTRVLSLLWQQEPAVHPLLAKHPNTAPYLLEGFIERPELSAYVAQNSALSEESRAALRKQLLKGVSAWTDYKDLISFTGGLACLALQTTSSPELLRSLAKDAVAHHALGVALSLLFNPATPEDEAPDLKRLALCLLFPHFPPLTREHYEIERRWMSARSFVLIAPNLGEASTQSPGAASIPSGAAYL